MGTIPLAEMTGALSSAQPITVNNTNIPTRSIRAPSFQTPSGEHEN